MFTKATFTRIRSEALFLWALYTRLTDHRIALIAAGVAFYGLLALFPAITAGLALGGLLVDPEQIVAQLALFSDVIPEQAMAIVMRQATAVAGSQSLGLELAAWVGLGVALYAASRGVNGLMQGMNAAHETRETRGFLMATATRLGLTLALIIGAVLGLAATIVLPAALAFLPLGAFSVVLVWVFMFVAFLLGLTTLYRFGPAQPFRFRQSAKGAGVALVLWLLGSAAFATYVGNFANYNQSFGALGGVIVLLTWFWLSAFIILLGAEVNAALNLRRPPETPAPEPTPEST
jgi:membrane protein